MSPLPEHNITFYVDRNEQLHPYIWLILFGNNNVVIDKILLSQQSKQSKEILFFFAIAAPSFNYFLYENKVKNGSKNGNNFFFSTFLFYMCQIGSLILFQNIKQLQRNKVYYTILY